MPIRIHRNLPAFKILRKEGVMVMSNVDADRQDIRPLKIALLNLMPIKIETETQFARLVGSTPLQIELTLVHMATHASKTTPAAHMKSFYKSFPEIADNKYDGLIITGAPIEHLDYEQVSYWEELKSIFDWSQTNVYSTLAVCWGAMAMMKYFYDIPKYQLKEKAFGCFEHNITDHDNKYLHGFTDRVLIPVSRWSELREDDIKKHPSLAVLLSSKNVGPCLIQDNEHKALYMINHLEYDTNTLKMEFIRDSVRDKKTSVPLNYFPDDDINQKPLNLWRSHAYLLYGNWLNNVYQNTPYDISKI